jgi:hypothetical protein
VIGKPILDFGFWILDFYVAHSFLKSKIFLPSHQSPVTITYSDTNPVTICKETDSAAWRKQ